MKKIKLSLILSVILTLSACAPADQNEQDRANFAKLPAETITSNLESQKIADLEEILRKAKEGATCEESTILTNGNDMITAQEIVIGSCWDYIDAIYNRAGYTQKKRLTIFRSQKDEGPFADVSTIRTGDWLYFVNHSFHDHEHSAIFVSWIDFETKEALMISYAGGNQNKPARYHTYILTSVYNIMRPNPKY